MYMKNIKLILAGIVAVIALNGTVVALVFADCQSASECISQGANEAGGSTTPKKDVGALIKDIVNTLLYILGAVAVIMIVIGGIQYTISNGDSSKVTAAKNTILYAVIGLIVAILAYAIVNFVVTRLIQ